MGGVAGGSSVGGRGQQCGGQGTVVWGARGRGQ